MKSNEFVRRFSKMFWAPTTDLGNPLFKRTSENNDKELLKILENDVEYSTLIDKKWTSPSNVRAIFVGINKAFVILHRGLSEGDNKVVEVNISKRTEGIYPIAGIEDGGYKIYTFDKLVKDQNTGLGRPADPDNYELVKLSTDPISLVGTKWILPNLEFLFLSWTAFGPGNDPKIALDELFSSKRLESIVYFPENPDKILGTYEKQIREYAQSKYTSIFDFVPDLKKGEIFNHQVDFKQFIDVKTGQWAYDTFLSKWNETLIKDKENKEDTKPEDDLKDLVCLNKGFTANYQGSKVIEVQKRDDYTVKINLCVPGKDYYNDLEDVHYTGDKTKVVITGTASEVWLTKPQKVIDTYIKLDGSPITKEDFMNLGGGILEVKPKSNSNKCFAYHIPIDQRDKFYIKTSWGDNLKINATYAKGTQNHIEHGDGDWVICYGKDGKPDLEHQAVINGLIFWNTYKKYEEVSEKADNSLTEENSKFIEELRKAGWSAPEGLTDEIVSRLKKEVESV